MTDEQTDGRTDKIPISILRVSIAVLDLLVWGWEHSRCSPGHQIFYKLFDAVHTVITY